MPIGLKPHFYQCRSDAFQGEEIFDVDLIEELPIVISYNEIVHAVMMITPVDVEAFLVGFSYSEGVISESQEIRDLVIKSSFHDGVSCLIADLVLSPRAFHAYKQHQIARKGSSGCGLCGVESLHFALPSLPPLYESKECFLTDDQLLHFRDSISQYQRLGQQVGAIHAAILISAKGDVLTSHEDIGRHNALDKVIGWALKESCALESASVLMTSRCSSELIQKAVRAGVHALIHLASPSALAVEQARRYGLNLIHLPRRGHPRYFLLNNPHQVETNTP